MIIGASLMLPVISHAEDYQWLTFTMTDNTEMSVAAENLTITYNETDRSLQLKSATVNNRLAVDNIKSMRFTETMGVNAPEVDGISTGNVEFYNIDGVKSGVFSSIEEARTSLPSGIYVVKNNGKSFKVIF